MKWRRSEERKRAKRRLADQLLLQVAAETLGTIEQGITVTVRPLEATWDPSLPAGGKAGSYTVSKVSL